MHGTLDRSAFELCGRDPWGRPEAFPVRRPRSVAPAVAISSIRTLPGPASPLYALNGLVVRPREPARPSPRNGESGTRRSNHRALVTVEPPLVGSKWAWDRRRQRRPQIRGPASVSLPEPKGLPYARESGSSDRVPALESQMKAGFPHGSPPASPGPGTVSQEGGSRRLSTNPSTGSGAITKNAFALPNRPRCLPDHRSPPA